MKHFQKFHFVIKSRSTFFFDKYENDAVYTSATACYNIINDIQRKYVFNIVHSSSKVTSINYIYDIYITQKSKRKGRNIL